MNSKSHESIKTQVARNSPRKQVRSPAMQAPQGVVEVAALKMFIAGYIDMLNSAQPFCDNNLMSYSHQNPQES